MKTALREIARVHTGDFRLTPSQNLTISGVTTAQKPVIDAILARHGLAKENKRSGLRLTVHRHHLLPFQVGERCGAKESCKTRRSAKGSLSQEDNCFIIQCEVADR